MGDPRKRRKRYHTPVHPWQKTAIDEEKALKREFGFKNKKEQWKMQTLLTKYKDSAKKLIALRTSQAERERAQLLGKLVQLGLLNAGSTLDDVLGLDVKHVMERRLQSIVFRKGYARSMKQARQFITHRHVLVDGKVITFPNFLVSIEDQPTISFRASSTLFSESHPERGDPKKAAKPAEAPTKEVKEEPKAKEKKKEGAQEVKDTTQEAKSEEAPAKEPKAEEKSEEPTPEPAKEAAPVAEAEQ